MTRQPSSPPADNGHRALLDGPCFFCRRPMNWLAASAECLPWCRWCLAYLRELFVWAPKYGQLLMARANEAGMRRGERVRFVVEPAEWRN